MKAKLYILLAIALGLAVSLWQVGGPNATAADPAVAFVGVNVIPMDSEQLIANQTVITAGDRIQEIGPAESTPVPTDAVRVDGDGRYLMPGLAEMHGHIPAPDQPQQLTEDVLFLYVANGVTTVRGMQGATGQLELRQRVQAGEILGPNLYLAGPSFNGDDVTTVDAAIQRVLEQKAAGWNLLKVQRGLTIPVYDAMARTAQQEGIRFGGHVPADVGLLHAIEHGQETFDHLDGYVEYLADADGNIDEGKLQEVVAMTREAGGWVVPTMALWEVLRGTLDVETVKNYSETQYMPPEMVEQWTSRVEAARSNPNFDAEASRRLIQNRMRILRALHDDGVRILLGTDSPQVFSIPGFSIHREMERMVAAGMTPYEVLRSGTRNVGEYFANEGDFGTIEVGKRADLILVDRNPLEDVGNVAGKSGVMVRGRWLPETDIRERLQSIGVSYSSD